LRAPHSSFATRRFDTERRIARKSASAPPASDDHAARGGAAETHLLLAGACFSITREMPGAWACDCAENAAGQTAKKVKAEPLSCRQSAQWQMPMRRGSPRTEICACPQRHFPENTVMAIPVCLMSQCRASNARARVASVSRSGGTQRGMMRNTASTKQYAAKPSKPTPTTANNV
jgi:hypothetical protein